ncbi:MAG: hypothetical protein DI585_07280 [Pseudomonas fluorescens]|nr:MAG: hypothetical protein DI585_07280 [Pseudomonas fluorescens]
MLNINACRAVLLTAALFASACASSVNPKQNLELTFQNGQTAIVKLNDTNPEIRNAFLNWVDQGVYAQTPVYRQFPGVFLLAGKPRLKGEGYISGPGTPLKPKHPHYGQIGLVIHADGTVGPELLMVYGVGLTSCCEAPQSIVIGRITSGKGDLGTVQRGDNLQTIAIQP